MISHINVIYTKKNSWVMKSWEGNGKFKWYLFKAYSLASNLDNLWNIYLPGLLMLVSKIDIKNNSLW